MDFSATLAGTVESFNETDYALRLAQTLSVAMQDITLTVTAASIIVVARIAADNASHANTHLATLAQLTSSTDTLSTALGVRVESVLPATASAVLVLAPSPPSPPPPSGPPPPWPAHPPAPPGSMQESYVDFTMDARGPSSRRKRQLQSEEEGGGLGQLPQSDVGGGEGEAAAPQETPAGAMGGELPEGAQQLIMEHVTDVLDEYSYGAVEVAVNGTSSNVLITGECHVLLPIVLRVVGGILEHISAELERPLRIREQPSCRVRYLATPNNTLEQLPPPSPPAAPTELGAGRVPLSEEAQAVTANDASAPGLLILLGILLPVLVVLSVCISCFCRKVSPTLRTSSKVLPVQPARSRVDAPRGAPQEALLRQTPEPAAVPLPEGPRQVGGPSAAAAAIPAAVGTSRGSTSQQGDRDGDQQAATPAARAKAAVAATPLSKTAAHVPLGNSISAAPSYRPAPDSPIRGEVRRGFVPEVLTRWLPAERLPLSRAIVTELRRRRSRPSEPPPLRLAATEGGPSPKDEEPPGLYRPASAPPFCGTPPGGLAKLAPELPPSAQEAVGTQASLRGECSRPVAHLSDGDPYRSPLRPAPAAPAAPVSPEAWQQMPVGPATRGQMPTSQETASHEVSPCAPSGFASVATPSPTTGASAQNTPERSLAADSPERSLAAESLERPSPPGSSVRPVDSIRGVVRSINASAAISGHYRRAPPLPSSIATLAQRRAAAAINPPDGSQRACRQRPDSPFQEDGPSSLTLFKSRVYPA